MRGGRLFIILGVLILFGALIVGGVLWIRSQQQQQQVLPVPEGTPMPEEPSRMKQIVVAAQNIPLGMLITEDAGAVMLESWPEESVPEGALASLQAVYGKTTRQKIMRGAPVLESMLIDVASGEPGPGSITAIMIPEGRVAYALAVAGNASVAWALQPGDHVDVLLSLLMADIDEEYQSVLPSAQIICASGEEGGMECQEVPSGRIEILPNGAMMIEGPSEDQRPRLVTQLTVQDAVVLRVGAWSEEREEPQPEEGEPAPVEGAGAVETAPPGLLTKWVTLGVTPQDALVLKYAEEAGASIDFALRRAGDTQTVSTESVTLQYLMDRFNIELPPKLPYGVMPGPVLRSGAAGEVVSEQGPGVEYSRRHEVSGQQGGEQ
jgi:Flp pilus assembly protein CpaB